MSVFAEMVSAMPLLHVTTSRGMGLTHEHQYVAEHRLKLDFPT